MFKAALVGAVAFSLTALVPATAQVAGAGRQVQVPVERAVSDAHIAQAKAMLMLRPEQEPKWARVAAALRAVRKDPAAQQAGVRRVMAAAGPLIRSLDPDQKRTAAMMVRALGFSQYASAL